MIKTVAKWLKIDRRGRRRFVLEPRYDKGQLAKEILRGLAVGGVFVFSLALPNLVQLLKLFEPADRRKVRKVLSRLRARKLVRVYEENGQDIVELSEKGKREVLKFDLEEMVLNTKRRWDGVWRIVLFDIPEKYKPARLALQLKLGALGFYRYQKSVYITPHQCRQEVAFLKEFYGVGRYVKYLEVSELEDEIDLLRHFGLT